VQSIIDANQPDSSAGGETPMNCTSGILAAVNPGDENAAASRLPALLDAIQNAGITDPAQRAYILATAQTEDSFTPQDEGDDSFKRSGKAGIYYGRGDVQLTWKSNYQYWSRRLGVDLVGSPELANRSDISAEILVQGMRDGTFTGQKLSQYINSSTGHLDFAGARHIVNDSDKTGATAEAAQSFYSALQNCSSSGGSGSSGGATTTQSYPGKLISSADGNATEQKIVQAINAHYGASSAGGPDQGNEACAYELNQVLQSAIDKKIGVNTNSVPSVETALESGDGTQIHPEQAHAGDIVVFRGTRGEHIGFCTNDGCSQVISNSSSKASFTWVSSRSYYDSYYSSNSSEHIYRVNG
jgi:hypothetical protein